MTDECQRFLEHELSRFAGSESEFANYAREHAREWFPSCNSPPEWIHNAEWQFEDGRPMCFVGQVSIPQSAGIFHDEASIFVFANAKGAIKTVLQVS